ncbi:hypothetical protein FraEuI1c_0893 [Pseudofrankia inefficax]|uniref:Uncharacterized protein n=1 Tax=Pseudofrankia inefficax (strain DSM 45817 / CECT 9037 / DDB 130130 / EuI1c) TaxID=298654 RepID=E3IXF2_PSEI1|nr:hypothetical protein FraEuI1c_0893 [Pseudofrankia inefficax]
MECGLAVFGFSAGKERDFVWYVFALTWAHRFLTLEEREVNFGEPRSEVAKDEAGLKLHHVVVVSTGAVPMAFDVEEQPPADPGLGFGCLPNEFQQHPRRGFEIFTRSHHVVERYSCGSGTAGRTVGSLLARQ